MSVPPNLLQSAQADSLRGQSHYLRAIASMAQDQSLVLRDSIYTANGVRLAEKGMSLDSAFYDSLVNERLRHPIEELVDVRQLVDVPTLEAECMTLCESAVLPRMLMRALGEGEQWRLLAPLCDMAWPQQASFKLTVMRNQRQALYEHSLSMMLVSLYLGVRQGLNDEQLAQLAAAALLHDVGMLFMDPSWTDPQHKLTQDERRQLSVHSITAMLVVRSTAAYPAEVEMAVLEHHERMDGSGYPRNMSGEQISPLGQILLVAEVVSAFFDKFERDRPAMRLSLMLRLNRQRFPVDLVGHVHQLLRLAPELGTTDLQSAVAEVRQSLARLSMLLDHWQRLRGRLPVKWQVLPSGRAGMFMDARMGGLEAELAEAGALPQQQIATMHWMAHSPEALTEQSFINREALWQLETSAHTCLRRWPRVMERQDAVAQAVAEWIDQALAVLTGKSLKDGAASPDA